MNRWTRIVSVFFVSVLLLGSMPSQAGRVILWGTSHNMLSGTSGDPCAKAHEEIRELFETRYNEAQKAIPEVIYAEEQGRKNIRSVEDESLRTWMALPVALKGWTLLYRDHLLAGEVSRDIVLGSIESFGAVFESAKTLSINLLDDFDRFSKGRLNTADSHVRNDLVNLSGGSGAIEKTWFANLLKKAMKDARAFQSESLASDYLQRWIDFAKFVSDQYLAKNIYPFPQKYNLAVHHENSTYDGKTIFVLLRDGLLFSNMALLTQGLDPNTDVLLTDWRDHFIAKNVANLIRENPKAPILIWFGEAHMAGVVKNLSANPSVDLDQILVLTQTHSPSVACTAAEVLARTLASDDEVPTAREWKAAHIAKTANVAVWTLAGNPILQRTWTPPSPLPEDSNAWESSLRGPVLKLLEPHIKNMGIYLVQIEFDDGQKITLRVVRTKDQLL